MGLYGVKYGNETVEIKARLALLDTGGTLVNLPEPDYNKLLTKICKDQYCFTS